ncbi:MAG TPA: hypothetical protein VGO35_11505 [Gammaproteobacteria bacterium]|nr:hypothetical protein [Gammaproteobacteria bacterium]
MILAPASRKLALTVHVATSVAWLGAVACFLALAIAGVVSRDPQAVRAAYLAMDLITLFVIVPLAFASLLSGLVCSLGTTWGLFRYYWVLLKLLITPLATIVLLMHTQPIGFLADAATKTAMFGAGLYGMQVLMVVVSAGAVLVLLLLTLLAVYKPKGMTRYGWRKQASTP